MLLFSGWFTSELPEDLQRQASNLNKEARSQEDRERKPVEGPVEVHLSHKICAVGTCKLFSLSKCFC